MKSYFDRGHKRTLTNRAPVAIMLQAAKKDESTKGGSHKSLGYHDSFRSSNYCNMSQYRSWNKNLAHILYLCCFYSFGSIKINLI
ncbi:hypothetical protein L5515_012069 [Caenorhabditis briggsae]|uniref:Uncharacterized protein n=1 Tax=Caenorhabditis briggsae TaxID=6238 RepID=A0AAE9D7C9_CAEBR|nr:hypothetical protein L3Y34_004975 [Caenorhabditis briggsae]UMM29990.1 hypothetical protein L5515_012069 [Caenorhabditis briggsae]